MTFSTPKEDDNLTTINLAEVSHTIFYAPQYAAIQNGYFEEEGMEINLILTPGADKVPQHYFPKMQISGYPVQKRPSMYTTVANKTI